MAESGTGYRQNCLYRILNILNFRISPLLSMTFQRGVANRRDETTTGNEYAAVSSLPDKTASQVFSVFGNFSSLLQITDDPRTEMLAETVTTAIRHRLTLLFFNV